MKHFLRLWVFLPVLLAGSCMEQADLTAYTESKVPCVQCVLQPELDVQTLRLFYINTANYAEEPIPDATVEVFETSKIYQETLHQSIGTFYHREGVTWKAIFNNSLKPSKQYLLRIILPSQDTLTATTVIPYDHLTNLDKGSYQYHHLNGGRKPILVHPSYDCEDSKYRTRFTLVHEVDDDVIGDVIPYTLWIWKMDWNEQKSLYEIANTIATDQEAKTDPFNICGDSFTSITNKDIQASFPTLSDKPLHYKYLRIPQEVLSYSYDLMIAGDFKGPHYRDPLVGPGTDNLPPEFDIFPWVERGPKGYLVFLIVSRELDLFLKDDIREQMLTDLEDLLLIYRDTNHYTNIRNSSGGPCFGVFGAAFEEHLWWSYYQGKQ